VEFTIKVNQVTLKNKYGEYGLDDNEKGKTLSSELEIGGTVEPDTEMDSLVPELDKLMDQAFDTVKRGVKRASEETKEDKGW